MSPRDQASVGYQRTYYLQPHQRSRIAPGRSPYVLRHLDEALMALAPPSGARILELGCGMGRFTSLLAAEGFEMTGVDLSPELVDAARSYDSAERSRFLACDAAEVDRHVQGPFDAVVGFFFLHHLPHLGPTLTAAARLLAPGGRMAFCEPNALNPLFYLQILGTRGMTWRGDGGVARMRRRVVGAAFRSAGLESDQVRRYGFFPPALANLEQGARWERRIEALTPLRPILPFQIFAGTLVG